MIAEHYRRRLLGITGPLDAAARAEVRTSEEPAATQVKKYRTTGNEIHAARYNTAGQWQPTHDDYEHAWQALDIADSDTIAKVMAKRLGCRKSLVIEWLDRNERRPTAELWKRLHPGWTHDEIAEDIGWTRHQVTYALRHMATVRRPPGKKLTQEQWSELLRRKAEGECVTHLAKEFGISRPLIYQRMKAWARK